MKIIESFLNEINEFKNWRELKLLVEIQPGMIGFKAWAILDNGEMKSLSAKPPIEIRRYFKDLHINTAKDLETRWNKLEFILFKNTDFKSSFIWDSEWQRAIDIENNNFKMRNPDYKLPKWKWEDESDTII